MHFGDRAHTYSDEGLVETVEAQVPDEPPTDKRRNKPKVEVGDHQEWSAAHHPREHREQFYFECFGYENHLIHAKSTPS